MRLTRKTCGYVGNVPTPAGYTDPLVTRSHTQMNNMTVIIWTHTSNGQDMTTSIYDSALGKFALGWWRKLQSAAQRHEEAAGTVGVYVICARMCVCAGGHTRGRSGPQDISALLLVSWRLWGNSPQHWSLPGELKSSSCPDPAWGSKAVTTVQ